MQKKKEVNFVAPWWLLPVMNKPFLQVEQLVQIISHNLKSGWLTFSIHVPLKTHNLPTGSLISSNELSKQASGSEEACSHRQHS